jgi:hypothetical protein
VRLKRLGYSLGEIQDWLSRNRWAQGKVPLRDEGGADRSEYGRRWYRAASRYVKAGERDIAKRTKAFRALFDNLVPEKPVPQKPSSGGRRRCRLADEIKRPKVQRRG